MTSSPNDIALALAGIGIKNDEESTVTQFLDSGFAPLNHGSNAKWDGGFPVGRMIEIAGPPSSGKTALATKAMAKAQQMGGIAGFMDHERSFSLLLAPNLGLDTTPGRFVFKKPRTFEESVELFSKVVVHVRKKKLIASTAPICWVFDSLAAMVPQSVLFDSKGKERSMEDRNMNDNTALSRATSAYFPSLAMLAEENNVCVIFLNQIRTKIGVTFGDPRKTTGGDSPAFYFSQRLWLGATQIKKGTEVIGMEVSGKYMKNKIARPFQTAKWRFMFKADGTGFFDVQRSLIEFLLEEGCLPTVDATGKACKPGFVFFDGKQIDRESLARQIEAEGAAGMKRLEALLPDAYAPEVVAELDVDDLALEE